MSDVDMQDGSPSADPASDTSFDPLQIHGEDPNLIKIRILPGDTPTAASYEILNEDHTLGNALRHVIMRNPDVEFCGYSIPHPSDPKMNIRIQTYDNVNVHEVLQKGLEDLMELCDVITTKVRDSREAFAQQQTLSR